MFNNYVWRLYLKSNGNKVVQLLSTATLSVVQMKLKVLISLGRHGNLYTNYRKLKGDRIICG